MYPKGHLRMSEQSSGTGTGLIAFSDRSHPQHDPDLVESNLINYLDPSRTKTKTLVP